MKTLTESLRSTQKAASSRPFVEAILTDAWGLVPRFRFERVYTGAEPIGHTAVAVLGTGTLIRARVDISDDTLYVQRVTTPTSGSTFSSWTSHGTVSLTGTISLVAFGAQSAMLVFVHADQVRVRWKITTDDGATWSAAATIATGADVVTHVAVGANPSGSGSVVAFWYDSDDGNVYSSAYTGTWSAAAAWAESIATITGIAVTYRNDFQLVITGTAPTTSDAKVWTIIYGDGFDLTAGTWGDLLAIETAVSGTSVSFHSPSVCFASSAYRLFFLEKFTGSVASRRVVQSWLDLDFAFADERWREPWPFEYTTSDDFGVAVADDGAGEAWISTPAGVWLGEIGSVATVDVSADVVAAAVDESETDGKAFVELDNSAGTYTSHEAVARGMRLSLTPGYHTTDGDEAPAESWYWVDEVELITGPRPRAVLHARNGWWLLERWHAKRQYSWAAGAENLVDVLNFVFARAGLTSNTGSVSTTLGTWQPAFTIHPGESGKSVVLRILDRLPDLVYFDQDAGEVVDVAAADASVYAYGGADEHVIVEGRYRDVGLAVNRVRVQGSAAVAEEIDYADIEAVGERLAAPVRDIGLDTTTLVEDRAGFDLRAAEIRERRDVLEIFGVNCGQQLLDVVTITDAAAGLSAVKRRVLGLSWSFKEGRYGMRLTLGMA